jgi:hypothetical protein
MNAWNAKFIRSKFDQQAMGYITNIEGKIEIQHPTVGAEIRRLVSEEGARLDSPETIRRARVSFLANKEQNKFPYMQPLFGYIVTWLSELGKSNELDSLKEVLVASARGRRYESPSGRRLINLSRPPI